MFQEGRLLVRRRPVRPLPRRLPGLLGLDDLLEGLVVQVVVGPLRQRLLLDLLAELLAGQAGGCRATGMSQSRLAEHAG